MKSSQNEPISKKKKKKMAESNPPTNTSQLPPAVLDSNAPSIALESSSVRGKKKPNAASIMIRVHGRLDMMSLSHLRNKMVTVMFLQYMNQTKYLENGFELKDINIGSNVRVNYLI